MIIFMFGIVLTLVLFIAMGFVRGEGMSWRVNKKQLLALVGVLVIVFSCYVSIPAGHTGVVTTFGSVENYTLEAGMHFKLVAAGHQDGQPRAEEHAGYVLLLLRHSGGQHDLHRELSDQQAGCHDDL